jgi:hypothetical protein
MCKENKWNGNEREIEILLVKYAPIQLRTPQIYAERPGFEPAPHGELLTTAWAIAKKFGFIVTGIQRSDFLMIISVFSDKLQINWAFQWTDGVVSWCEGDILLLLLLLILLLFLCIFNCAMRRFWNTIKLYNLWKKINCLLLRKHGMDWKNKKFGTQII